MGRSASSGPQSLRSVRPPRLDRVVLRPTAQLFSEQEEWVERVRASGGDYLGVQFDEIGGREMEIVGTSFTQSRAHSVEFVDSRLVDCDLANVAWNKWSLERVELRGCRLTGAVFSEAALNDVVFVDCQIGLASLRFARLSHVRFDNCHLVEADFQASRLLGCIFQRCDMSAVQFSQAEFERSGFRDCQLRGLAGLEFLKGTSLTWSDLMELAPAMAKHLGIGLIEDEDED